MLIDVFNDHNLYFLGIFCIIIPVRTPREVIAGLAKAIERLARDEPFRQTLARGALLRARAFDWEEKAKVLDRIYRAKVAGG